MAFRATYLINPEGVLEHISINNMGIGRNIDETKRVLQAVQFVAEHGEVCPESSHAPPPADSASPVAFELDPRLVQFTTAIWNAECLPVRSVALLSSDRPSPGVQDSLLT